MLEVDSHLVSDDPVGIPRRERQSMDERPPAVQLARLEIMHERQQNSQLVRSSKSKTVLKVS